LKKNINSNYIDRSKLFLYYNTRILMGTVNVDSGAYLRDVLKAAQKYGICNETLWQYDLNNWKTEPTKCIIKMLLLLRLINI
jgi:hypothetical protein